MNLWPKSQLPADTWNRITLPIQRKVVMTATSGVGISGNWCLCTFWYFCKLQKGKKKKNGGFIYSLGDRSEFCSALL